MLKSKFPGYTPPKQPLLGLVTASAHIRAANLRGFSRDVDTAVRCPLEEITQAILAGQIVSSAESRRTVSVKPEGQRRRDRSENFPSNANSGSLI